MFTDFRLRCHLRNAIISILTEEGRFTERLSGKQNKNFVYLRGGENAFWGLSRASMDYRTQSPAILRDFLTYHETIQGHSRKTVDEYFLDLRTFFRFIKLEKGSVPRTTEFDQISIDDITIETVETKLHRSAQDVDKQASR